MIDETIQQCADAIRDAEALLICSGAGMGVDSGLPDFRGDRGFWKAYPPLARLGIRFVEMANPRWFDRDPALAWGFYGHRLDLYKKTAPHSGFEILRRWTEAMPCGCFVFTSNVDGHFQRAGFDVEAIEECHGSIHHLQCSQPCSDAIWPVGDLALSVDEADLRARSPLPRCPSCGEVARPNILLFDDGRWNARRTMEQGDRFRRWLRGHGEKRLVVVECGAGLAVPTVRYTSEQVVADEDVRTLIRINPREPDVPAGHLSLPLGAREALERIDGLS